MKAIEFEIGNDWDIGHTRRYIVEESRKIGFNDIELGEISIVINELCTNFIKHNAVAGTLSFKILNESGMTGIEIVARDKGPGIRDVDEVIKDGISSRGTMGGGLGAIKRLMDFFEIHSSHISERSCHPGFDSAGTVIILRKWAEIKAKHEESDIKISVLSRPYPDAKANGDFYYIKKLKGRCILSVIDGLGHGAEACAAAKLTSGIINDHTHKSVTDILIEINKGLMHSRGAVAGIVQIDTIKKEFEYSVVGNIDFRYITNGKTERMISTNGLLGACMNSIIKTQRKSYEKGSIITMCTDGIINKWDFSSYPNVDSSKPSVLSNLIIRDYGRNNDDATILVAILE